MFSRLIPFSVPSIENKFIKNLIKSIIRRDFYKGSDQVILEQEFSQYIGTKYAVCFSSARFALYQIYKSLNLKDKKVLFPSYTCIPALDALRWAGGIPRFLDIELESYSIIPDEELQNEQDIKGICLTHLYGLVGNIDWVLNFAKERGIPIIEDAAIAFGAQYGDKKIGQLGEAAVFSFQSSKIMTSWRGGIVTTNNEDLYNQLKLIQIKSKPPPFLQVISNLFITYGRNKLSHPKVYRNFLYAVKNLVFSPKLQSITASIINQNPLEAINGQSPLKLPNKEGKQFINIQAKIIRSSLIHIESNIIRRRSIAQKYQKEFCDLKGFHCPALIYTQFKQHTFGRFPIRISGINKSNLHLELLKEGIETSIYYPYICPETPHVQNLHSQQEFINALIAKEETLLLPIHDYLSDADLDKIIKAVKKIYYKIRRE